MTARMDKRMQKQNTSFCLMLVSKQISDEHHWKHSCRDSVENTWVLTGVPTCPAPLLFIGQSMRDRHNAAELGTTSKKKLFLSTSHKLTEWDRTATAPCSLLSRDRCQFGDKTQPNQKHQCNFCLDLPSWLLAWSALTNQFSSSLTKPQNCIQNSIWFTNSHQLNQVPFWLCFLYYVHNSAMKHTMTEISSQCHSWGFLPWVLQSNADAEGWCPDIAEPILATCRGEDNTVLDRFKNETYHSVSST